MHYNHPALSADDCLEMVHQLNFGEDDETAKKWLMEAEARITDDDEELAVQIHKYKLHYGINDL